MRLGEREERGETGELGEEYGMMADVEDLRQERFLASFPENSLSDIGSHVTDFCRFGFDRFVAAELSFGVTTPNSYPKSYLK